MLGIAVARSHFLLLFNRGHRAKIGKLYAKRFRKFPNTLPKVSYSLLNLKIFDVLFFKL